MLSRHPLKRQRSQAGTEATRPTPAIATGWLISARLRTKGGGHGDAPTSGGRGSARRHGARPPSP
jgi:hypothetical protein